MMLYDSIDQMWYDLIHKLLIAPQLYSRDGNCREITAWQGTLSTVDYTYLNNPMRRLSLSYAAAEILWYLSETNSTYMIEQYAPSYKRFTEDGKAWGAYGPRLIPSLKKAVEILSEEPNSRQVVCPIYSANDIVAAAKGHDRPADIPCTISLQFLIRGEHLHCIATMRSNDVWLGMPYDIFAFTTLQKLVASELNVKPGFYTHQVGSLHLYERHFTRANLIDPSISVLHHYDQDGSTFENRHNALDAEFFYRSNTNGRQDFKHRVYGKTYQDLVLACRKKFHPECEGRFYSQAFTYSHFRRDEDVSQ